jgi:serine/threonine protein kinase
VIVAIGGGAGTLSEIALGWQLGKGIIAVDLEEGWSSKMAGMRLDSRIERPIAYARSIDDVIFHIGERLPSISSSPIPSETVIDGRFIVRDRFRVMANREHYRLRDHKHNVNYAMKTHVRTSERDWKQFESEIQMVKSLSHQSIPTIISDGQLDVGGVSRRYMVTEWHPVSLSEVKVMEMETPSLMELYGRILDTCCYLEEKRILHRDLKPGNILINEKTCHPILNDFYRFQAFDDQTTYEYNNKREDMFNMGKLLLYLITGRYDFKPTHIDDLSRHRGGDDYDMGSIRALIRGMVDPEPDCRPSSFAKVRGELAGMTGAMK